MYHFLPSEITVIGFLFVYAYKLFCTVHFFHYWLVSCINFMKFVKESEDCKILFQIKKKLGFPFPHLYLIVFVFLTFTSHYDIFLLSFPQLQLFSWHLWICTYRYWYRTYIYITIKLFGTLSRLWKVSWQLIFPAKAV